MKTVTIQGALQTLKDSKFIVQDASVIAAVQHIRERDPDPIEVGMTLAQIVGCDSFNTEFISKDPTKVQREREIYNSYLLKYLACGLIRSKDVQGDIQFRAVYRDSVQKSIHATTERLYGSMTWIDAGAQQEPIKWPMPYKIAGLIEEAKQKAASINEETKVSEATNDAVVVKAPKQKKEGSKVNKIFARVVELYVQQGMSRDEGIKIITQEFEIKKPVTAMTYFNDALRNHGVPKDQRHR